MYAYAKLGTDRVGLFLRPKRGSEEGTMVNYVRLVLVPGGAFPLCWGSGAQHTGRTTQLESKRQLSSTRVLSSSNDLDVEKAAR